MSEKKEEKKEKGEQKFAAAAAAAAAAAVIEAMGDGLIVTDLDGNVISMNRAMEELLVKRGVSIDVKKLIGKSALDLPHIRPEDVEKYVELMKEVIEKGRAGPLEVRGATGGWDSITCSLLKDADGNPTALFSVVRDITELKRAEEERARAVAAVTDAMGDGLITFDTDAKITAVNPAFEKMFGREKNEFIGKDAADMAKKCIKTEELEKVVEAFGTALRGIAPTPFALTGIKEDGREFPLTFTASFIKDTEGKPTHIVATVKDITELKRLQEKERKATADRARAEEAEKFTEELRKKINELEEFSKIAVERELEMKKLEEELEKLREKK